MPKPKRIFVSNRLPFSINAQGELKRGSGGLVSALLGVSLEDPFMWFGFETQKKNLKVIEERASEIKANLECHPVYLDPVVYDKYYDGFSNDLIWPLFHYEGHLASFNRDNWQAYMEANETMAAEIAAVAKPGDTIWIHDFHFLLLPKYLREKAPDVRIGFFLHIPFPSAEVFRQLPVREEILSALVYCDLIGFHEHSYLRQFIVSLTAILGVDASLFKAEIGEHTLNLGVYPISVDSVYLKEKAESPEVLEQCRIYRENKNNRAPFMILGVDRLDYTKGLELKLKGFQQALKKYPELVGNITLLQLAVPTREKVPAYIEIKNEVDQLVGSINGEFGKPEYNPVQYIFNSVTETELLALYRRANVNLVTSKRDGMNLVAMEYIIAQDLETPGTLILSEFAGSASLLSDALIINPWDVDAIADAIYQAYRMPLLERQERVEHLQAILSRYSATKWAEGFLADLEVIKDDPRKHVTHLMTPKRRSWPAALKDVLHSQKIRIFLDYDGTVVALTKRPDKAFLVDETKALLFGLHEKMEVYILSGRSQVFLDYQFKDVPVYLAAEHGGYFKPPGGEWLNRISSDIKSWYPQVEKVMQVYTDRVPLSFIERKNASLVWHFRESPSDFAMFQARRLDDELQIGLSNEPVSVAMGKKIVEAKAIECNKGNFLRWLMQSSDPNEKCSYICIGDDRTDEDMFNAVGSEGISIKIGTGPTAANYRLNEQEAVIDFFKELIEFFNEATQKDLV